MFTTMIATEMVAAIKPMAAAPNQTLDESRYMLFLVFRLATAD
jgi:hypothetical protein